MRVERESDLHRQIVLLCRANGWYVLHSRMDRRTTCNVGAPDFVIALPDGVTVWVEAKTTKGKLTDVQVETQEKLRKLGHIYIVVRSLDEFIEAV